MCIGVLTPSPSSFTPSYFLKVTKFLVKISQFELLVMTEKNIFAYRLFLLNISDFILFFMWKLQPLPEKSHPLFPSNSSLKGGGEGAYYGLRRKL